jgi:hypothetical protein
MRRQGVGTGGHARLRGETERGRMDASALRLVILEEPIGTFYDFRALMRSETSR